MITVVLLLLVGGLVAVRRRGLPHPSWLRRALRRKSSPVEVDGLVELYRRFLAQLARRGVHRETHLTPLEFATEAAQRSGMPGEVRELTDLFCRARYGGKGLNAEEAGRAEHLIRRLRDAPAS